MSIYRRNAKRDKNEPEIIEALLKLGFSVRRISAAGVPDLVVGKDKITRVVEVKGTKGTLTDEQIVFWSGWLGNPKIILRSLDDVETLTRYWKRGHRLAVFLAS